MEQVNDSEVDAFGNACMGFSLEKLSFILNLIYCYKNAQIVSLTDGYQDTKPLIWQSVNQNV